MKKYNSNTNYRRHLLLMLALVIPFITMMAQGYNQDLYKQGDDVGTVYVNTKAPGVHKEYDSKYGGYVWKNSMGSYICRDENMKPIHDIDKNVFFDGDKKSSSVHKEYDNERKCYIWKDDTGNFLGRDKPQKQEVKSWLDSPDKDWMKKGTVPKGELSKASQQAREEIKRRLQDLEMQQYDAQNKRARQEDDVDRNSRRGGSISMSDDGEGGGSVSGVKYEDVDYADIENLLNNLDNHVNTMAGELAIARKTLHNHGMTEYSTLIGNAQSTINHYRQKRQSTRDLAKMVRYADASVSEMEQQLNIINQALVNAGTASQYSGKISRMRSGLTKYRADRKRIRFHDE